MGWGGVSQCVRVCGMGRSESVCEGVWDGMGRSESVCEGVWDGEE